MHHTPIVRYFYGNDATMNRTKRTLFFTLLTAFSLVANAQFDQTLTSTLDSLRQASGYPGIVYAYVTKDGTSHPITSGWADKEQEIKMTSDHLLHSGSTGKTVVSAVLMCLLIDGKIDLDAPVKTYLGENEWYNQLPNAATMTLRHLMQHSSGIQRYEFKEAFLKDVSEQKEKVWKPEDLLQYILDDEPLFEAGNGFSYADTNYILVGMIIEKVTGEKFYDLADQWVFQPTKLTSFTPTNTREITNMAQGYYDAGSEYALGFDSPFLKDGKTQNNMQWEWTGGGYAYKTHEYAQLLKLLYEGKVFDLEKVRDDYFDYIESPEIGGQYAMAVHKLSLPGIGEVIGHSGFFPGYNTVGFYHPKTGMSFTMQINVTNLPQLRTFFRDYMILTQKVLKEYK